MSNQFDIMGVLNVTPDSFSDGGKNFRYEAAIVSAIKMVEQGASIIDIGGESTRPGSIPVSLEEESQRVIPVLKALKNHNPEITISVDTSKPEIMQQSIDYGVDLINDVNALQADGALKIVAKSQVTVCLMHKKGDPKTMQNCPQYDNVTEEILVFFSERINACLKEGIPKEKIILDPGIGFGKTLNHNLQILNNISKFNELGCPILIGASRKSMIGDILNEPNPMNRVNGSLAIAQYAYMQGAQYLRVHDVKATNDVLKITKELISYG